MHKRSLNILRMSIPQLPKCEAVEANANRVSGRILQFEKLQRGANLFNILHADSALNGLSPLLITGAQGKGLEDVIGRACHWGHYL